MESRISTVFREVQHWDSPRCDRKYQSKIVSRPGQFRICYVTFVTNYKTIACAETLLYSPWFQRMTWPSQLCHQTCFVFVANSLSMWTFHRHKLVTLKLWSKRVKGKYNKGLNSIEGRAQIYTGPCGPINGYYPCSIMGQPQGRNCIARPYVLLMGLCLVAILYWTLWATVSSAHPHMLTACGLGPRFYRGRGGPRWLVLACSRGVGSGFLILKMLLWLHGAHAALGEWRRGSCGTTSAAGGWALGSGPKILYLKGPCGSPL